MDDREHSGFYKLVFRPIHSASRTQITHSPSRHARGSLIQSSYRRARDKTAVSTSIVFTSQPPEHSLTPDSNADGPLTCCWGDIQDSEAPNQYLFVVFRRTCPKSDITEKILPFFLLTRKDKK